MDDPIRHDVVDLAAAEGLGRHRGTVLPKRLSAAMICNLMFMVIVGLFLFVLPAAWFVWVALQTPNFSRKAAARRLHFFEHGLVEIDRKGELAAFRWDSMMALQEITETYVNGFHTSTTYRYTLHKKDGTVRKITDFYAEPGTWGPFIQQEIASAQLPGMLRMLDEDQQLVFGDISLNRGGIATPKRGAVAWAEIEDVRVDNGVVALRKSGKWLSWSSKPVKTIPNFVLFLALVDHLRRSADAAVR
ncbi:MULTISPECIES: DUF6585 family protein [unclassified Streptomyces]|uniref:DUF6585 family protein n=1 Tax=unclassified Streptomyces TaxID=2593676 RepID=UPI001F03F636|nr:MULTISPECIES: DUF6585 family protein [unclassified Streptomyces]MCH0564661.1 hypothetical protein [Streptomyces sp. MUM 2J]MCH0570361.1 hypothetical protein [Streptomyces sp. MUM 136J]